jgi:hypothetical protein
MIRNQYLVYFIEISIPKLLFNPAIIGGVSDIRLSVSVSVVGDVYRRKIRVELKNKNQNISLYSII